jgi:hypothetical protein
MTVNAILSTGLSPHPSAVQSAKSGGQSYSDWVANLTSALSGSSASNASSGTLSDQMQALLTQLQAGNTVAPSGAHSAASSGASSAAASAAGASGQTHHHQHHSGSDAFSGAGSSTIGSSGAAADASGGILQDLATNLVGSTASAAGSGSDSLFGGGSNTLLNGLNSLGGTALTGVKQALQAYAAMHGVQAA